MSDYYNDADEKDYDEDAEDTDWEDEDEDDDEDGVAHAPVAWGADPTEWDGYGTAEDQPDEWRRP